MTDLNDDDITEAVKLPLDDWHRDLGARMVEFAGCHMPIQYEGIMAEHRWTRERAGLFDVSHMGQLQLRGDGAAEALEAIVPGDISSLKPGNVRYSMLLDDNGGIVDDLMVTNHGDHLYLVVNGATKWGDIDYLRDKLPDTVDLVHMDDDLLLALQGPEAVAVLTRLVPEVGELSFMQAGRFEWRGFPLLVSRSGYTGEDGFEISVQERAAEMLAGALVDQGEVRPIGLGARDSLRLEAGLPLYGHDIDRTTTPVEAGLAFAISKARRAEGGFAGSDRVLAELTSGAPRKRVGLSVEGRQPIREGAQVVNGEGEPIGTVTSGGFSPTLERPIAMAYVPADLAKADTVVEIEQRGKRIEATVTKMPFVPHRYHRN